MNVETTDLNELDTLTAEWSHDRGILTNGNAITQCLKLMSELGELADNLAKGKDVTDDIGDCAVVLCNISRLSGTTLGKCWNHSYNEIKDRKGFLNEHGNFIKEEDPSYQQLKMEFDKAYEPLITELSWSFDLIHRCCMIRVSTDRVELLEFYPHNGRDIPDNIPTIFKGKTIAQLKSFLSTIGDIK